MYDDAIVNRAFNSGNKDPQIIQTIVGIMTFATSLLIRVSLVLSFGSFFCTHAGEGFSYHAACCAETDGNGP
eukprot:CAMPEP_0173173928 /NCGR_PEP_ID=MMETSP1141-20130122/3087_1 /TAXON_ID=483371 /ORGANISM="non described non described, Strain CCMP2298" /LENGTH=71 /DNA_ID=CAMNT_0014096031 /DNA_START=633 /DNA_END=845 /DNA_ORIENTATION=+